MAAVEKERRKQALDTENAIVNRIAKIEDDELKNAADIVNKKDFSTDFAYFDKNGDPTPKAQALLDGTYAKKEAEKRIATDSKLKTLRERQSKLTELIERPQPQATKKERPSGGGMITVTGEQRPGDPYRKGTRAIVTPDGTQIIAEKLENGKYSIKTKKEVPGVPSKWQRLPGEVPEEEIVRRFPENEIPAFTQKERPAPAQAERPAPPKEAYPEFDINDALRGTPPVVTEDMLRDVPSTGLLPPGLEKAYIPGYPGIDENYIDPYAGYIPDERDRTGSGLPPPGFEEWLRSQYQ